MSCLRHPAIPFLLSLCSFAVAQGHKHPAALLKPLESVVSSLRGCGHVDEAEAVQRVLRELGADPKVLDRLSAIKSGKTKAVPAAVLASLRQATGGLAAQLGKLDGADRTRLAETLLQLDSGCAAAQQALGRQRVGADWLTADGIACRERQAQIDEALQQALRLKFPITGKAVSHPLFAKVGIAQPTEVTFGAMTVISEWPVDKAVRAVRTVAQAAALSRWLLDGKLEFTPRSCRYLHFAQRTKYLAAVVELLAEGRIDAAEAVAVGPLHAFDPPGGWRWEQDITEASFATALLYDDGYYRIKQAWLLGGHVDWIGRALIGAPLGQYAFEEKGGTIAGGTAADWLKERFGKAGLAGARIWMRHLAEKREDPPWSRAFLDQVGKIPFTELVKCTLVHEYLLQHRWLVPLVAAPVDPAPFRDAVPAVTGFGFEQLDGRWRQWLIGTGQRSVLDRLSGPDPELPDAGEAKALAYLQGLRDRALPKPQTQEHPAPPVGFERSLADGCLLHARYLGLNKDQLSAWPDAHEEYPDRPGYTAAGSFAGGHSVIAGAATMTAAIDAWMGTFYHRVPLLDPGLMAVGFGLAGGTAVLDPGSMCLPSDTTYLMSMWPPVDGHDMPLRFSPEMPNPVPGEDQGQWGYPVTFQLHLPEPYDPGSVTMTLKVGGPEGESVDCWFSSPVAPTNGEIAPADVYCLIPKAALRGKTQYVVEVRRPEGLVAQWGFNTR